MTETTEDGTQLEELLRMLKETRGFDFTGYKRSTLQRRIDRRMVAVGVSSVDEYHGYLEAQPDEHALLFDSLLINVTSFFRDAPAWQALREQVLRPLLESKPPTPARPLRVWSAGCSSGQEAYTLAMLLAEELGPDLFRRAVKIYGTDLDEGALQTARAGVYTEEQLQEIPPILRDRYFEGPPEGRMFRRDLRRQLIFGRNDLISDAPISRVDLLMIRNTLMYFNADAQSAIVRKLHFALLDTGFIFLGKAEMLTTHGDWFEPVDLRMRMFRKVPHNRFELTPAGPASERRPAGGSEIEVAALAAGPVAQVALDLNDNLAVANAQAEAMFGLHRVDLGRPFRDLELSFRPVELRSVVERVKTEQHLVELQGVRWQRSVGVEPRILDVAVTPLFDPAGALLGIGIGFDDVTHYSRLHEELGRANDELERAYQELQSLNEEMETTNEELQSTNEELETTNEELQSTNEELETTNEELQSTNDELQEINDALRVRTGQLDGLTAFLGSVMESLGDAVIVVGGALDVVLWNPGAEELWGLRADEAHGRPLAELDIGLPVEQIGPMARAVLDNPGQGPVTEMIDATNRKGRKVRLQIVAALLREAGLARGVLLTANAADGR